MSSRHHQHGVVLITSLLLLIIVTVLVVSSIRMGTVNLRIVDNMQSKQATQAIASQAANRVLSDVDFFTPTGTYDFQNNEALTIDSTTVTISPRECVGTTPASGYSAKWNLAPEDNTWEYTATVTSANGINGATARIGTGVVIRMTAGSCP